MEASNSITFICNYKKKQKFFWIFYYVTEIYIKERPFFLKKESLIASVLATYMTMISNFFIIIINKLLANPTIITFLK